MDVILLERIPRLGQMGDIVRVKNGFARNFLLPQGKALRATEDNKKHFESQRAQLEARNLERRQEAEDVHEKLDGTQIILIRSASANGQLYGSVTARDVAEALDETGFTVTRAQVQLDQPIKTLGVAEVVVRLHPEVDSHITVNTARSTEEAERQAAGEDVISADFVADRAEGAVAAEFFEEGAFSEEDEIADEETESAETDVESADGDNDKRD